MSKAKKGEIVTKCDICGRTIEIRPNPRSLRPKLCRKPTTVTSKSGDIVHICGQCLEERREVRL